MERDYYRKKMKLYDKLGASKFQKIVFQVEKIKFKLLKTLFPNFINYFDKYCDFQKKISLKFAKTDEERKQIIRNTKFSKMAMRKEMLEEKNRNYHMDSKRPTEIFKYLEWNKKVHQHGILKDAIVIPLLVGGVITNIPGALPLLIVELLSAGINFECINIQNYNICRLKTIEQGLRRREEQIQKKEIEKYGEAAEVIYKSIEQQENLPSFDDILNNINNVEQLKQMRELFQRTQEERAKEKKGGK